MERLSHDLNLALEESNCGRHERRKFGMRRRTRSAGNLPVAVSVSLVDDCSSSSPPPQAPLVTQPLSDSDDPSLSIYKPSTLKPKNYCHMGNFESDSFNENFSPTRPANTRRKRKFKKIPTEYMDGKQSPPIEILSVSVEPCTLPAPKMFQNQGFNHGVQSKHRGLLKPERSTFCGKRKWSHRDRGDNCEMRERSFSGGCSSKSTFFGKGDFKSRKYDTDKKRKEVLQPGKIVLKVAKPSSSTFTSLPGSSSFNFVYKSNKNGAPTLTGYKITTDLPPFFNPTPSTSSGKTSDGKSHRRKLNKTHPSNSLRNPLMFDDSNGGMDCAGNESSSLSSSDSDGVVTNDSDREGDDELTDWPGIEELKVFNKSLSLKSHIKTNNTPQSLNSMPPPKRLKKEKSLIKSAWASCKNKLKKKKNKEESGNEDDAMISDSKTVVDLEDDFITKNVNDFTSFSDVKNAGVFGQDANEKFFRSFQAFQEKSQQDEDFSPAPRTNFSLQKTSSSDLNASEKSPQSDHYCSEHSMGAAGTSEVREIRAGCRRIRDERPGFLILSAANEQLSKFLQDSFQTELTLPFQDADEKEKLESLAKLYSLELQIENGRPVLRKTSNTMQAIRVEHSYHNFPSDHKRRCYGDEQYSSDNSVTSLNDVAEELELPDASNLSQPEHFADTFSHSLVNKSLLDPGDID